MSLTWDGDLAERCSYVEKSSIRKIFEMAERMTGLIRLEVGEPDFATPEEIVVCAKQAASAGKIGTTSMMGARDLREAVAARYLRDFGLAVDPDSEVIITAGGAPALQFALLAVGNPGDEILVPDPGYPTYVQLVKLVGCKPVLYGLSETAEGFQLNLESINQAASPRTRAIILNSPSNPTGAVISARDVEALGRLVESLRLVVISDEVYDCLLYEGARHVCLPLQQAFSKRTIIIGSASKTFAMSGWRVGCALGPAPVIEQMGKFQSLTNICANRIGQVAYREALNGVANESLSKMYAEYGRRRELVVRSLNGMAGVRCPRPLGAFYAFPNISELGMDDVEFCEQLLTRYKVTCVPGSGFGPSGTGHVRISYANSLENLEEAMKRMEVFVQEIRQ